MGNVRSGNNNQSSKILARGVALHRVGQIEPAMALYRQALTLDPEASDAWNLLGLACHQAGQSKDGAKHISQAIQLNDRVANYFANLGMVLGALGQMDLALSAYRRALSLNPELDDVWYNLANLQQGIGRIEESALSYEQALRLAPRAPDALNNLGVIYKLLNRFPEAERCYRRVLELTPDSAHAHGNLGALLELLCRFEEALRHAGEAVRLDPCLAAHWINLGLVQHGLRALDQAEASYRQALQLEPQNAAGHQNLAMLKLQAGDFATGWREFEWRLQCENSGMPAWVHSRPRWDGSPLAGRTLLLLAEQGYGDTLQFARFASLAAEQGGRVILQCQQPLVRLLAGLAGASQVIPATAPLPEFECWAPLMSLPFLLGTTLESLPRSVPYIRLLPNRARSLELPLTSRKRVGLCWSSNVNSKNNLHRLIQLRTLQPLLELERCEFFSFQKGPPNREIDNLPEKLRPTDLTGCIQDFADTAILTAQMDLIISVDTVMAHLAGAMNVPVWTILSCNSDWRWLFDRTDSPWYPSMRIFRQARPGDWDDVIGRLRNELGSNWEKPALRLRDTPDTSCD